MNDKKKIQFTKTDCRIKMYLEDVFTSLSFGIRLSTNIVIIVFE